MLLSSQLDDIYVKARDRLLRLHHEANAGHLGGNFSCLEALIALYHLVMKPDDLFILSKGHAAGAWYVTLWSCGKLSSERLESFCRDGGLPGHPSGDIPGLLFPTGSLGHGPSLAAGLALAAKEQRAKRRVYCLCSDGEWQEGSNWEALNFIVKHRLPVTIVIDQNGWQGFGRTKEVISTDDLTPRLTAFGLETSHCCGHTWAPLVEALSARPVGPSGVVLDTIKGHSLPFFEDRLESHYLPLTERQYQSACREPVDRKSGGGL